MALTPYFRPSAALAVSVALVVAGLLAASAGCGAGSDERHLTPEEPLLPPNTSSTAALVSLSPDGQDDSPFGRETPESADPEDPEANPGAENGSEQPSQDSQESEAGDELPITLIPVIVKELNHDPTAFTQGLEYYEGRLFEGTGAPSGRTSTIRELDPESGGAVRSKELDATSSARASRS